MVWSANGTNHWTGASSAQPRESDSLSSKSARDNRSNPFTSCYIQSKITRSISRSVFLTTISCTISTQYCLDPKKEAERANEGEDEEEYNVPVNTKASKGKQKAKTAINKDNQTPSGSTESTAKGGVKSRKKNTSSRLSSFVVN